MYSLAFLTLSAFLLCLALTPLVRELALRLQIVDRPDGARKAHHRPIPRIGGVAIAIAYTASFALFLLLPLKARWMIFEPHLPFVARLLPVAGLVFALGLLDDVYGLRPWHKLLGQAAAATLAFYAGVGVSAVAGIPVDPMWAFPLTVLWLVACTNAFNLIDGLDGLACGLGLCATLSILVAALVDGNVPLALATAPLAGCLVAFLRYNFNPASIFLGDSGSLLIGFLLGCYGIIWSQKSATLLGLTAPAIALAGPLGDVLLSVARRWLRRQPIFRGDRGHIHHQLLRRGVTPRRAVLLLYATGGLAAALSLTAGLFQNRAAGVVIVLFCAAAGLGVYALRYAEFRVAGNLLRQGAFQRLLNAEVNLSGLRDALRAAPSDRERFEVLREACGRLGLGSVSARLNGVEYGRLPAGGGDWETRIPLSGGDYVRLSALEAGADWPMALAPLAAILREAVPASPRAIRKMPVAAEVGSPMAGPVSEAG